MARSAVLLILLAVSYQCNGGLLDGILSGAHTVHSKVHDVATSVLGGLAHGVNFNVQGQFGAHGQRPQIPERPGDTVTVVVVEQKPDSNQYRPGHNELRPQNPNEYRPQNNNHYGDGPHNHPFQGQGNSNKNPYHHHHNPGYGNENGPNNGYGNGNRPNNGYGNGNQPNNGYGNVIQPNNGYGNGNQPNNGYWNGNQANNGYGNGNQPNNGYGNGNQPNNGYGNGNQQNNGYGNGNQPNNGYGNGNQPNNGYGNGYQTNNDYGNNGGDLTNYGNSNNNGIPNRPSENTNQNRPHNQEQTTEHVSKGPEPNTPTYGSIYNPTTEHNYGQQNNNHNEKSTKKPTDDAPLLIPLNPNEYIYHGDKIEVTAPKRETDENLKKPADDDDNFPIDIRFQDQ